MNGLAGGTAVVTGAGSGIGRSLALTWAAEGMSVVVADIEAEAARRVAAEVEGLGGASLAVECDVSDPASVQSLAARAHEELGAVRMLCNNAGVYLDKPLLDCDLDDWRWVFGVNLFGIVHCVDAFLPAMRSQQGPAHILNTASDAGVMNRLPAANTEGDDLAAVSWGVYQASKHAVVSYSEQLANALEATPIGVSVLCPSPVATSIFDSERHRPATMGRPSQASGDGVDVEQHPAAAIDPDEAAAITLRAIERGRFYIFTHSTPREGVQRRCTEILDDLELR
jgi:NAD(P)-dependent dehydrogenase (short-subunit alcohol dehydrogenase family)